MPYMYAGDYYGGRGDPGIWSGLTGLAKRFGAGIFKRSPIGMVAGGIGGALTGGPGIRPPARPGAIQITPGAFLPGGVPLISRAGAEGAPRGYHLDKKTGTRWVRNRSMNPANPRALRRAIRREQSFVGLAKRALRGTGITISRRSVASKGAARGRARR